MPGWITPELVGFAAAVLGWAWSKIRDDKRAKASQVAEWAKWAFNAVEGIAASGKLIPPSSTAKIETWTSFIKQYARAAGVKLTRRDWDVAAGVRDSLAEADKASAKKVAAALAALAKR